MKRNLKNYFVILIVLLVSLACKYVVVPDDLIVSSTSFDDWGAVVTGVTQNENGDLHIDITLQNATGQWSTMHAKEGSPAIFNSGGDPINCDVVFVGTGGHRLAPGLQIRGYTTGSKLEPVVQPMYVECADAEAEPGATLTIDYVAYYGELDYYHQDANQAAGTLELSLDEIVTDLTYPVFGDIEDLVKPADADIPAISNNSVNLVDVQRTETGLIFHWKNFNPTEFALRTHIGTPPVVGDDGIIYGIYQIMDMVSVPLTPPNGEAQWTTEQVIPADVGNLYILLSVEDKQMRLYVHHLIDISDM